MIYMKSFFLWGNLVKVLKIRDYAVIYHHVYAELYTMIMKIKKFKIYSIEFVFFFAIWKKRLNLKSVEN